MPIALAFDSAGLPEFRGRKVSPSARWQQVDPVPQSLLLARFWREQAVEVDTIRCRRANTACSTLRSHRSPRAGRSQRNLDPGMGASQAAITERC